jgi:DNA-binding NtrC family response regulator
LREARGRSGRRGDDRTAGEAALALGRLMLVRGQPSEALRAFDSARHHLDRARLPAEAVRAAVFAGLAETDAGCWREAEAGLHAAATAADRIGNADARRLAGLALARCLYWQGRIDAAIDALALVPFDLGGSPAAEPAGAHQVREPAEVVPESHAWPAGLDPFAFGAMATSVARACLAARLAIAGRDLQAAGQAAQEACARAARSLNPTERAAACLAMASVHGATGNVDGLRRQVAEGLEAARRARAPLRAVRLRLVLADGLRRAGRPADARAVKSRLERLDARRLPAVVRLPLQRVLRGGRDRCLATVDTRHGGPGRRVAAAVVGPCPPDPVVEVLTVCQETEDEGLALAKAVSIVRGRVGARSVACLGLDQDRMVGLAAEGPGGVSDALCRRVIGGGLDPVPALSVLGGEAGVPVRLGGRLIGLLVGRWLEATPPQWARVGTVLAAVAAAVAPCVRAALDRRADPVVPAPWGMLGVSEAVATLRREVARAAGAPFSVVVEGESGSGKELVARSLHRLGPRRAGAFYALNCATLSDELADAELFGHARGAFTGAVAERRGLFEEAHRGTLMLDEVTELSGRAQAKLLRVLQEGEVRRVGESLPRAVDVRVVAATNRPLRAAVGAGLFRRDLLYRLEVIRIVVPPLRTRVEDIPVLAAHFWAEATKQLGSRATLAPTTLAALARYDWPGNVRELQNVVAALAVAVGRRGSAGPERLPHPIAGRAERESSLTLEGARRLFEAGFVRAALARAGGRRARAAAALGVTRQGLAKLVARLGLEPSA